MTRLSLYSFSPLLLHSPQWYASTWRPKKRLQYPSLSVSLSPLSLMINVLVLNNASPDLTAVRISLNVLFARSPLVSGLSAVFMTHVIDRPSASLSRFLYCAVCCSTSSGVDPANISSIFAYLPFFLVPFVGCDCGSL